MELLKKIIFLSFILFILILFVWALYIPKHDVTETISTVIKEQKDRFDLYYKGITLQEISNGVKYWEIKAAQSLINKSTNIASLENTEGTFFKDKNPVLKFKAPKAIWKIHKKEIILYKPIGYDANAEKNNLLAFFSKPTPNYFQFPSYSSKTKGFFFQSEKLKWDLKTKAINCEDGLWIQKGQISGIAQNLKADVAMENVIISGNPRIYLSNENPTMLEASGFLIDNIHDTIHALKGVTITSSGSQIKALNAVYNDFKKNIQIKGNVIATYKDFIAKSDEANYNLTTRKIELVKKSTLLKGKSVLAGEKIIIDLQTKNVSVIGKSKVIIPDEELTIESL